MNAHINLDLGIAAAETSPGDELPALKDDFDKINQVLASLVDGVQQELAEIWPILGFFNRYLGSVQKTLINFSMEKARDAAWEFAEDLAFLSGNEREVCIEKKDKQMANFAKLIRYPGFWGCLIMSLIRLGEKGRVVSRIEILE